ncbi:MAG: hypothetical protein M1833_002293 [Piccolia ochrophora]|nr:MAG: hypothetical protein M1833_002293 [Piccolia ochrophora]
MRFSIPTAALVLLAPLSLAQDLGDLQESLNAALGTDAPAIPTNILSGLETLTANPSLLSNLPSDLSIPAEYSSYLDGASSLTNLISNIASPTGLRAGGPDATEQGGGNINPAQTGGPRSGGDSDDAGVALQAPLAIAGMAALGIAGLAAWL